MTLTRRLLLSYLALLAVMATVLTVAADRLLGKLLTHELLRDLEREAALMAPTLAGLGRAELDAAVRGLGERTGRRLTVVDGSGRVLADSDFPLDQVEPLEDHADRPEIRAALQGRAGSDVRLSASTGRRELKVAVPFPDGAVRVSAPVPQAGQLVTQAKRAVLLATLLALGVAALLAFGFSVNVARPLVRLRNAAQELAAGGRPTIDVRGRHEVGDVARALRSLQERLAERIDRLERERDETQALITAMNEGVIACDARGAVTTINPAARALFGMDPAADPPPVLDLFRHRTTREAVQATLDGATCTGLEIEAGGRTGILSGQPLRGGGAVFVIHDVTELKRLAGVRRDFVANVSHELKTPLTVVRGYAETLLSDDPPQETRRKFQESILASARGMQHLVDDLLDLSRIESGAWQPEPAVVQLEQLVEESWASVSAKSPSPAASLRTEMPGDAARAMADPEAVRQILTNLLDNSRRHTPEGGTITVRASRRGGDVEVSVEDTGSGIASEHVPRIFERFYRVDAARSREQGGTGLGLSIVRHLVEAHGGHVSAESALGRGTTVRFTLPAPST